MTTDLPPGWVSSTLGEIGRYYNGRAFKSTDWGEVGRPIVRIQNLTGSGSKYNHFRGQVDPRHVVNHGDLLVSWAATLGVFVWRGPEAILNQHIFKVESHISPRFHRWLLESVVTDLYRQAHGSGMVHITKKKFELTTVRLPPADEQERIVAAIEEHFSRLDALESSLQSSLMSVATLRLSILRYAFCLDQSLPDRWEQKEIGEVADVRLGRQRSPQHHSGPQMRPYLRAANVTWGGINLDDVKEMNFDTSDFETHRLHPGDLLLNEASGSPNEVGKPAVWRGEIEDCCFQNTLLRLQACDIDSDYLYWYCYMAAMTGRFGEASRGVNIRHLGKQGLARFPIAVAPRAEQKDIVTRLQEQFQQLSECETSIRQALERARALRRSILTKAFAGQLVTQRPGK